MSLQSVAPDPEHTPVSKRTRVRMVGHASNQHRLHEKRRDTNCVDEEAEQATPVSYHEAPDLDQTEDSFTR